MKESPTKAIFSFDNHIIRSVSFHEPASEQKEVTIDFDVSGEYNTTTGIFKLTLRFWSKYGDADTLIDLTAEGFFKFETPLPIAEFPPYFYSNSIAILYPYLRAFVTTFTSVANAKPLILPTLNLNSLAEPLKETTKVIN